MRNEGGISIPYGCDSRERLKSVMLHNPGRTLSLINSGNCRNWLFDRVPDLNGFAREHMLYRELLASRGIKVYELSEYVCRNGALMGQLPNLMYLNDIAVVSRCGAILSRMAFPGRKKEEIVVKEALENLGIPVFADFPDPEDAFEGCLLLSPETLLVAATERCSYYSIWKFLRKALEEFREVIYIDLPKERRFMHLGTVFGRISRRLAIAYLPAFRETVLFSREGACRIDVRSFLKERKMDVVDISEAEQRRLACSFVTLQEGVIFHYDTALEKSTLKKLSRKGVEIIFFHPDSLLAGGGSLSCLTLRICRSGNENSHRIAE